jgi:diguanylate cyclase (GGDEF)-like protein
MNFPYHQVLLVEDAPVTAKLTAQMLRKSAAHRYAPVIATRLDEALVALQTAEFDVIILDLNLPDSSGLDTLAAIVAVARDVPILVLTATNDDEIGLRAVQLGAQDYLIKGEYNARAFERAIVYSSERHRLQRTIRQLAVMDELTGLYNRRGFNTLNPDILAKMKNTDARGFLGFFDLDDFKLINDTLGHARGDEALKEFASALQNIFRKDTLVVRLGGDEFVIMGVEAQPGQVALGLQALEHALTERNAAEDARFPLVASVGVVYFDRHATPTIEELSTAADAALYEHKQSRKRARAAAPVIEAALR